MPIGTKSKILLDTDDFEKISHLLRNADICCADFESVINGAAENDFVFADPPYTVAHNHNGFVKYNETIFSWEDQIRFSQCINNAMSRGVKVILTNANHPAIISLYEDITAPKYLNRKSVISADSRYRKITSELLFIIG